MGSCSLMSRIALMPTTLAGFYFFGLPAIMVTMTAILACVITEWLIERLMMKKSCSCYDGSAIITGLLLAFNVPSNLPLWMMALGGVIAIGIAKMPFGGLGRNPFNPALVGRAFLLASFPVQMTTWPIPGKNLMIRQGLPFNGLSRNSFWKSGKAFLVSSASRLSKIRPSAPPT